MIKVLGRRFPDLGIIYPGRSLEVFDDGVLGRLYNCENIEDVLGNVSGTSYEHQARVHNPDLFREHPNFSFLELTVDQLKDMAVGDSYNAVRDRDYGRPDNSCEIRLPSGLEINRGGKGYVSRGPSIKRVGSSSNHNGIANLRGFGSRDI